MNRRYFLRQLASGLVAATAPGLFLPKLIKPGWKTPTKRPEVVMCFGQDAAAVGKEYAIAFQLLADTAGNYRLEQVERLPRPPGAMMLTKRYEFGQHGVTSTTEMMEIRKEA